VDPDVCGLCTPAPGFHPHACWREWTTRGLFLREGDGLQFAEFLQGLRHKAGKSRYRLAQYSGLNESYILRPESGKRTNPSRDAVIMLALALVQGGAPTEIWDLDALLHFGMCPVGKHQETGPET